MKYFEKVVKTGEIKNIRKKHQGKKIGFCSGCFDVLHSGHAVFFEQCKDLADILVVSLGTDSVLAALKGKNRPVSPENNRLYLLSAMANVDYVVLGSNEIRSGKIDFYDNIKELKPDVFIINEDDSGLKEKELLCKELCIEVKKVKREAPDFLKMVSSTEIINKIKQSV